jgi:hypothetical protein
MGLLLFFRMLFPVAMVGKGYNLNFYVILESLKQSFYIEYQNNYQLDIC